MKKNVRCTKAAQEWNSVEKQSNYLRIWILQFGHNFIKQVAANYTCAVTCHTREKGYFAAQPILLAELFWLDFSNLGKQKSCIGVHQLNTLQRERRVPNKIVILKLFRRYPSSKACGRALRYM
jgi:hypothetical protein